MELSERVINKVFLTWFGMIQKFKFCILALWLAALALCLYPAKMFFSATVIDMLAPPQTQAYDARIALTETFPKLATEKQLVVLIQSENQSLLENDFLKQFSRFFSDSVYASNQANRIHDVLGHELIPLTGTAVDGAIKEQLKRFMSKDHKTSIVLLEYKGDAKQEMAQVSRGIVSKFRYNCSKNSDCTFADKISVYITGVDPLFSDILVGIEHDLVRMDGMTIPLALVVFWFFLFNWKLLLIPLVVIISSVIFSFALMYPIALYLINCNSIAPTLMSSVILALSTDYTLFLLTRYNEELKLATTLSGRARIEMAIANMVYYAGHVVVTSGCTLTLTFVAMIFYPSSFLSSLGVGVSLALIMTMFLNLLLTPSLLVAFPLFFSTQTHFWKNLFRGRSNSEEENAVAGRLLDRGSRTIDIDSQTEEHRLEKLEAQKKSLWFKWAMFWKPKPRAALCAILVIGLLAPGAYYARFLQTTPDDTQVFPRNSDSMIALDHLSKAFDAGVIGPYRVLIVNKKNASIINDEFWSINAKLVSTFLEKKLIVNESQVISITQGVRFGKFAFFDTPKKVNLALDDTTGSPISTQFRQIASKCLSDNRQAAVTTFMVDFNPFSQYATIWVEEARKILAEFQEQYSRRPSLNSTSQTRAPVPLVTSAPQTSIPTVSSSTAPAAPVPAVPSTSSPLLSSAPSTLPLTSAPKPQNSSAENSSDTASANPTSLFSATENDYGYEFHLLGGSIEQIDLVKTLNAIFPIMIGITCLVLLILVGYVFQSLFIPIRALLTIGLSVAWTYGVTTYIFTTRYREELFWVTPLFSFSVLVGLGLDYDIFLISRIIEYRYLSFSTSAAIVKGVYKTGKIITGAGIIMAIAFCGLMFSSMTMLVEFGVILTGAVLLDTFVVRTALVPAIMQLVGWFNFWPSSLSKSQSKGRGETYKPERDEDDTVNEAEEEFSTAAFQARRLALLKLISPESQYQRISSTD